MATGVGIDPVHFATFAVLNLMIGLTTPPVGVCLFVCANIAKAPLSSVIRAIFPFLIGNIVVYSWFRTSRNCHSGCRTCCSAPIDSRIRVLRPTYFLDPPGVRKPPGTSAAISSSCVTRISVSHFQH